MTLRITARLMASALLLAGLTASAGAQEAQTQPTPAPAAQAPAAPAPDSVVARIGGKDLTEADVDAAAQEIGAQFGQLPPEQRRLATISALIDVKALAAKAEAEGLQDEAAVARQIDFLRDRVLHNAYFEKHGVSAITEDELLARYEAEKARFVPQDEVHARHILVDTKEEADSIIARLDKGETFADLARELSKDPSSQNGGDLGTFGKGRMVPAFEEAAFALEPGKHSETPVETQFGWHVIEVVEKGKSAFPPFEQVREQARQVVMRDKYVEMLEKAREELKVDYVDPELKSQIDALEAGADAAQDAAPAAGQAPAQ